MNIIVISNTCSGEILINLLNLKRKYNTPFISTLIPNDLEYIKLCNNFVEYINLEPVCDNNPKNCTLFSIQNKRGCYNHKLIEIPYPIIHLGDVEIHLIHERNNLRDALEKFNRRRERLIKTMNEENYLILNILSITEFINFHNNLQEVINLYINGNKNNDKIINLFVGAEKYNLEKSKNYLIYENFIDDIVWDESHVNKQNNQKYNADKFFEYVRREINYK